jgi:hypothetical protein
MPCRFCGFYNGAHRCTATVTCPTLLEGVEKQVALARFEAGKTDGRTGLSQADTDPHYVMGWLRGESALEAAENGEEWTRL